MAAYLISWKPVDENKEYGWPEPKLVALAEKLQKTGVAEESWRFLRRRDVKVGERVFLLRQGMRGQAILGYGEVAKLPKPGDEYTPVSFQVLLSPQSKTVLATQDELHALANPKAVWNARGSGTRLPTQVAERLEKLVVNRQPVPDMGKTEPSEANWGPEELGASVDAYMEMQQALQSGKPLNKKSVYAGLAKRFGRTEKAYEYRMQNISYVLGLLGRRWLPGLVPARNVGANVAIQIEKILAEREKRPITAELAQEVQVQNAVAKGRLGEKPSGSQKPNTRTVEVKEFERDPKVKEWVLVNAKGKCESCRKTAPFRTMLGIPFLEVHHVCTLADGGSDKVENTVALCPNCHRALHYSVGRDKLISTLYENVRRLVRE